MTASLDSEARERLLPVYHFNRISTASGLPSDHVRSNVVRDRRGYVWIPTLEGLARYDGYWCNVFRHNPSDSTSIPSNSVTAAYIDSRDRLWLGTWDAGLCLYDAMHDNFKTFYPRPNDSLWLMHKLIWFIREDKSGNVWLAGPDGIVTMVNMADLQHDTSIDSIRRHIRFVTYRPGLPGKRVWDLVSWGENEVLVTTREGSFIIDPVSRIISRPQLLLTKNIRLDTLTRVSLFRENSSVIWLGTQNNDLFRLDERDGMVQRFSAWSSGARKSRGELWWIQMDGFGRLWTASSSGYELFDTSSSTYVDFLSASAKSPEYEGVEMRMSLDDRGTFWISAGKSGVFYVLPQSDLIQHYGLRDTGRTAVEMSTIDQWNDGSLWISAAGEAVNIDPTSLRVIRRIDLFKGEETSFDRQGAHSSYNDNKGNLWFGTWGLGLFKLELPSGRVTNFRPGSQLPDGLKNICRSIVQGSGDTLWIAGNTGGIFMFDTRTGRFSQPSDSLLRQYRNAYHLMKDRSGRIWLTDQRKGLLGVDLSRHSLRQFEYDRTDSLSVGSNAEVSYQDPLGRLWIGGIPLALMNPDNTTFVRYDNAIGGELLRTTPLGADRQGRLWTFDDVGLALLDPSTGYFSHYDWNDGLCGWVMSMSLLPNGRVVLAGRGGLNIVNPEDLHRSDAAPPVVLSRITINDTFDLRNLNEGHSLRLPFDSNVLEIEYAAIDLGLKYQISYRYRLEGLEETWIDPKDRRYVRYPGLRPGEYVFRVKAINNFQRWPDQEVALAISITPPWWQTWWAYNLYVIFVLGLLFGAYRLRLRQMYLREHADREHFQAERLAEVDRMKSRFFANISHEFRTPLTLILGPVEQMKELVKDPAALKRLDLIRSNATKVLGLVNQLLDFSKVESGAMKLQVCAGEIVRFVRRTVMSFESWAERKKIDLRFISEIESAEGFFDSEKLEKIVNNLLSNALKFTQEGGTIDVRINLNQVMADVPLGIRHSEFADPRATSQQAADEESASEAGIEMLRSTEHDSRNRLLTDFPKASREGGRGKVIAITVTDTGHGIPKEHLPHIFNRFYRADNSHAVEGTGIGLALVWELVQLHHGTVTVQSKLGEGSQFTVSLPIDMSEYTQGEILESHSATTTSENAFDIDTSAGYQPSVPVVPTDGKPIVLVVEDNADLRAYIREFLLADYAVHEAGNGKSGFDSAIEVIPDIVISDVMMPEMDGIQLCRALKEDVRTSHVPVILLTARAGTDSKVEGLETGADDYITKPFESKELLARAKNLIEQRKLLRKKFSAGVVLKPGEVAVTSLDDALLNKVMLCVEKNIADENFSVDDLAAEACLSRSQLSRKLHALTNLSPVEFIRYVRLQRAHELLEKNAGTITEIAYQVGFSSQSYFSASFRERFGYPPSRVRQNESS